MCIVKTKINIKNTFLTKQYFATYVAFSSYLSLSLSLYIYIYIYIYKEIYKNIYIYLCTFTHI